VRRIDTVNVLLSGQPHNVEFHRANWPSLLSVPRSAVWSLKGAIESLSDCVWAAKEVEEESGPLRFTWAPIKASSAIKGCWLIAIAPEAADYCSQVGLRLGQPGREHALQYNLRAPVPRYHYRYESWIDHIRRVMEEAQRMNAANAIGASRLESKCSLPAGNIFELLILAAALHDIGKLSKTWQKAAWDWETQKTGRTRLGAIAHTTKNLIEKGPDLPPHAVEGAYAVAESLAREFPSGCWPVSCAIARHHSARALQARPFELIDGAAAVLSQLDVPRLNLRNGTMGADLQDFPREIEIEWEDENRELWPIYAYLARRLRLADQAGARRGQGDPC
jgi:CRISPR-associated endonuclease/helicase Cas3